MRMTINRVKNLITLLKYKFNYLKTWCKELENADAMLSFTNMWLENYVH